MRNAHRPAALVAAVTLGILAALSPTRRAASDETLPDLGCRWEKVDRRGPVRAGRVRLRVQARLLVSADRLPAARRVTLEVHGSEDDVLDASDPLLLRRSLKLKPGRTRKVAVRKRLPLDPPVRHLLARIDTEDDVVESDEANNVAVHGPLSTGREYFPLETGDRWQFDGVLTETDGFQKPYLNVVDVRGPHSVGAGETAQAVHWLRGIVSEGEEETYFQLAPEGLIDWGSDQPDDVVAEHAGPYCLFPLPLVERYRCRALRFGGVPVPDMEGDGRRERMTVTRTVRFRGFEDVVLDDAVFAACARMRIRTRVAVQLTQLRRTVTVTLTEDRWLSPDVGPVRTERWYTPRRAGYRTEESMTDCIAGDTGHGVLRDVSLGDAPLASTSMLSVAPALATDGDRALLVTGATASDGSQSGLFGRLVTAKAVYGPWFQIDELSSGPTTTLRPSVCYGAGRYLVVYVFPGGPSRARTVTFEGDEPTVGALAEIPASVHVAVAPHASGFRVLRTHAAQGTSEAQVWLATLDEEGYLVDDQLLAEGGILINESVAIADDGTTSLCVWCGKDGLAFVRVDATGQVLDPDVRLLDPGLAHAVRPVAFPSPAGGWIVAWDHQASALPTRVRVAHVRPDGTSYPNGGRELGTLRWADTEATLAFDGRNVVVAATVYGASPSDVIRAVRLSATAEPLPEADGSIGVWLSEEDMSNRAARPSAAYLRGHALVAWRHYDLLTSGSTSFGGALLFPRHDVAPAVSAPSAPDDR